MIQAKEIRSLNPCHYVHMISERLPLPLRTTVGANRTVGDTSLLLGHGAFALFDVALPSPYTMHYSDYIRANEPGSHNTSFL